MKRPYAGAAAALILLTGAVASVPAVHAEQAITAIPVSAAAITSDAIVAHRTQDRIQDLTCTMIVNDDLTNRDELKKIGGAFATTATFHQMNVSYQYPNKARFEGRASIGSALMIYNGDDKAFKIPILPRQHQDVHGQPGQKQSLLDLGIFAKDWLTTDWEPHYLGRQNGDDEYRLSQRFSTNGSHEIVFVNPKTFIITRRLSYNGDNKLLKEMRFKNPVQVKPGIWVPTRIEVYNQFGKLGLVQDVQNIRLNMGVDPNLFNAK